MRAVLILVALPLHLDGHLGPFVLDHSRWRRHGHRVGDTRFTRVRR